MSELLQNYDTHDANRPTSRFTLTDEEREAILYCISCAQDYRDTCCHRRDRYDRATQLIGMAMRLALPNVGPAPVERQRSASVADVGGAGLTLTDEEREAIEWFAEVRKPLTRLTQSHNRERYKDTLCELLERLK
jgi:hypothetical protein